MSQNLRAAQEEVCMVGSLIAGTDYSGLGLVSASRNGNMEPEADIFDQAVLTEGGDSGTPGDQKSFNPSGMAGAPASSIAQTSSLSATSAPVIATAGEAIGNGTFASSRPAETNQIQSGIASADSVQQSTMGLAAGSTLPGATANNPAVAANKPAEYESAITFWDSAPQSSQATAQQSTPAATAETSRFGSFASTQQLPGVMSLTSTLNVGTGETDTLPSISLTEDKADQSMPAAGNPGEAVQTAGLVESTEQPAESIAASLLPASPQTGTDINSHAQTEAAHAIAPSLTAQTAPSSTGGDAGMAPASLFGQASEPAVTASNRNYMSPTASQSDTITGKAVSAGLFSAPEPSNPASSTATPVPAPAIAGQTLTSQIRGITNAAGLQSGAQGANAATGVSSPVQANKTSTPNYSANSGSADVVRTGVNTLARTHADAASSPLVGQGSEAAATIPDRGIANQAVSQLNSSPVTGVSAGSSFAPPSAETVASTAEPTSASAIPGQTSTSPVRGLTDLQGASIATGASGPIQAGNTSTSSPSANTGSVTAARPGVSISASKTQALSAAQPATENAAKQTESKHSTETTQQAHTPLVQIPLVPQPQQAQVEQNQNISINPDGSSGGILEAEDPLARIFQAMLVSGGSR
jgi:hypothetical protein